MNNLEPDKAPHDLVSPNQGHRSKRFPPLLPNQIIRSLSLPGLPRWRIETQFVPFVLAKPRTDAVRGTNNESPIRARQAQDKKVKPTRKGDRRIIPSSPVCSAVIHSCRPPSAPPCIGWVVGVCAFEGISPFYLSCKTYVGSIVWTTFSLCKSRSRMFLIF